ncbi:hypothetical protein MBUL_01679 [Methylobacterium bullatum]|uniref:Uncharacterized protein n=1 Tax=Methylobacterium bullatum TaxID=570505 RepID=A0A679J1M1_9HYPH|nr:hypothetical protein MBUL_01679 [Methylobacterium bullatum]
MPSDSLGALVAFRHGMLVHFGLNPADSVFIDKSKLWRILA